jgi:hypothetical protein
LRWQLNQNESDSAEDLDEEPTSYVFRWDGEWSSKPVPIIAVSVCHLARPEPTALFLGRNGVVVRLTPTVSFEPEVLDASSEGPQNWGDMREIRGIGGTAFACGMGRTVYRCMSAGVWDRFDQRIRVEAEDDADVGLNSIHGFDLGDIYAVGWSGEIWHRGPSKWTPRTSPTNLALLRVVCASWGEVFIGAQEGLILRGRDSSWGQLHLPNAEEDVTGAVEFQSKMYFSTAEALYRLDEAGLVPVTMGGGSKRIRIRPGESFGLLDATGLDRLLSKGVVRLRQSDHDVRS